jgi:hypothetical protein
MLGRIKQGAPMERREEEYECAEAVFLIKTFANVRNKIM